MKINRQKNQVWFSSDWHFCHYNVIKLNNRPFSSLEEMEGVIIDNINIQIKPKDILILGGDQFYKDRSNRVLEYFNRIKCENIYMIPGNHDHTIIKNLSSLRNSGRFKAIEYEFHLLIDGQPISLSHYRMESWNKSHYGAWQLYGHHHGMRGHDIPNKRLDIGVDCWDFKPISFDFVKEKFSH